MSEYVRQPVKEWHEIIAEKDAEIANLRIKNKKLFAELERASRVFSNTGMMDAHEFAESALELGRD